MIDGQCAKCEKHKPRKKNDCIIFQALFVKQTPVAVQNAHKLFDAKGICKSFKAKEQK